MDAITFEQVIKSIIIPVGFIILNTIIEALLAAASGLEDTDKTHRVRYVYKKSQKNVESLLDVETIMTFARNRDIEIIDIERLPSLQWWNYPSVSINLCIASLTTYAVALFSGWRNETELNSSTLFSLLYVNLVVLVAIIVLIIVANKAKHGDKINYRLGSVDKAVGCRILALVVSCLVAFATLLRFWSIV